MEQLQKLEARHILTAGVAVHAETRTAADAGAAASGVVTPARRLGEVRRERMAEAFPLRDTL